MGEPRVTPVDPRLFVARTRPPRSDDPRLGEVARGLGARSDVPAGAIVLLGVPDDRGIVASGGRAGAAEGPRAFREAFYRLPLGPANDLAAPAIYDAGDCLPAGSIAATHERVAECVARLAKHATTIVIGGGHDIAYGTCKGLRAVHRQLGAINIDAHLDVRPPEADGGIGSGTAFRRLLEEGILRGPDLAAFGIQPHAVATAHWAYARERGMRVWEWAECAAAGPDRIFEGLLADLGRDGRRVAISFDLDAIRAAEAPGVSAPAPIGLSAETALRLMQCAGHAAGVCHVEFMELSPPHDAHGLTARLAAVLCWHFCAARSRARQGKGSSA
ncbi:MAG: formimidoylglutamase [Deltaproteobacteria bacterium]|nr:formimidoylglutamase [Deltaproteobacteria bacterium]